jgi:hypothetical protein
MPETLFFFFLVHRDVECENNHGKIPKIFNFTSSKYDLSKVYYNPLYRKKKLENSINTK